MQDRFRHHALGILNDYKPQKTNLSKLIDDSLRSLPKDLPHKGFIRELAWGVVRRLNSIDFLIDGFSRNAGKIEYPVRNILRLGIFQILYSDGKIPHYAAVNESVELAKEIRRHNAAKFVNAVLRGIIRSKDELPWPTPSPCPLPLGERIKVRGSKTVVPDLSFAISIKYSHPQWLVERWIKRFGRDEAIKLCESNNIAPGLTIRANTLKISREDLKNGLEKEGVLSEYCKFSNDGLTLCENTEIGNLQGYKSGLFLVQDEASQIVATLLDTKPGELVLDLCSGAGIKTTHIAQLRQLKSKIIAVDNSQAQISRMKENLARLGIENIEVLKHDVCTLKGISADKILLDAPCSGLGIIRRKPDIKWNRNSKDVELRYPELQKRMLINASKLLKSGGAMVYSTCTTEPEENEELIEGFLKERKDFMLCKIELAGNCRQLVSQDGFYMRTFPHKHNMDGFFAVMLEKK